MWVIQSESGSIVRLVVALGIIVAWGLFAVRQRRHIKRLKRLYEEADIRMVGGPFDGVPLNYDTGGDMWPPTSTVIHHLRVEGENHFVPQRL